MIPVLVLVFYLPFQGNNIVAAVIFALAALTDWLDGYLARSLQQTSRLGAFLDPVADKLIVASALVLIVSAKSALPFLAIPAAVIVGREIVVSALREWMAAVGKHASVAVNLIAKIKTATQMVAVILLLIYNADTPVWLGLVGYFLLCVAAVLTLWSMIIYLKAAWPDLTSTQKKP